MTLKKILPYLAAVGMKAAPSVTRGPIQKTWFSAPLCHTDFTLPTEHAATGMKTGPGRISGSRGLVRRKNSVPLHFSHSILNCSCGIPGGAPKALCPVHAPLNRPFTGPPSSQLMLTNELRSREGPPHCHDGDKNIPPPSQSAWISFVVCFV